MTKRLKTVLTVAAISVLIILICLTVVFNIDKIYVFGERWGLLCKPIAIKQTSVDGLVQKSLDELGEMDNVTVDQSLMLINKQYRLDDGFVPQVSEYNSTTVYMNDCMIDAYAALSAAVRERTGNKLYVSSDLRTKEEQEALYRDDPLTATEAGASEHQTGLALDVYVARFSGDAFIKSSSGRFVNSHSWEYGFIIRYPAYAEDVTGIRHEPWHIRYVGHPHADVIYNNHTTLEEYVQSLEIGKWYEIDGYLVCRQSLDGGKLTIPQSFDECIISPDNLGNYIITVK